MHSYSWSTFVSPAGLERSSGLRQKMFRFLYIPRTSMMPDPMKELKKHILNESKREWARQGPWKGPIQFSWTNATTSKDRKFLGTFQRLECSLKEQNVLAKLSNTRQTRRAGDSCNVTLCSPGLSCCRITLHPLLQVWQQSWLPEGKASPLPVCLHTRLISDMFARCMQWQIQWQTRCLP